MKNQKDLYFIRYGNLNPVKHKEHRFKDDWHVAPRVKGIYAFPRGYIDYWLINSGYNVFWNVFLRDENGEKIVFRDLFYKFTDNLKPEYVRLLKKYKIPQKLLCRQEVDEVMYAAYKKPPKRFHYSGPIWSHLYKYVDEEDVIDRHKEWVKTSFKTYCKALRKCDVAMRFKTYIEYPWKDVPRQCFGNPHTCPSYYEREFFEVFIERL